MVSLAWGLSYYQNILDLDGLYFFQIITYQMYLNYQMYLRNSASAIVAMPPPVQPYQLINKFSSCGPTNY